MNSEEIRTLLGLTEVKQAKGCGRQRLVRPTHGTCEDERIRELNHLKEQLSMLRHACESERSMDACGILQGLADMKNEAKAQRHTHLG